jgi:flagellar basal-body rod protein FlgB
VSTVEGILKAALDGLSLRQRTIADNIANVETPRFLAGRVDFEQALRAAAADGAPAAAPSVARSLQPTRLNGNNVNLDEETMAAVETGLRYELTVTALTNKYNGIRTAIGPR